MISILSCSDSELYMYFISFLWNSRRVKANPKWQKRGCAYLELQVGVAWDWAQRTFRNNGNLCLHPLACMRTRGSSPSPLLAPPSLHCLVHMVCLCPTPEGLSPAHLYPSQVDGGREGGILQHSQLQGLFPWQCPSLHTPPLWFHPAAVTMGHSRSP